MDTQTLIAALDLSRQRLLAILDTIEKSGQDTQKVLAWRPGPGRAHIGWQAMHCAATHDAYLNKRILQQPLQFPDLAPAFAGGSTPSDQNVPTLRDIREKLAATFEPFKSFVVRQTPQSLTTMVGDPGKQRSIGESIILLTWHEAHHQGQIHLTWNCYKAAMGMK